MTLFDFQLNAIPEQVAILYQEGVYIGKQKQDGQIALLYQLDSFYVEVFYRKYRRYVARIKCSSSISILDPYLEQINVEHLVNI